ncbi:Protein CBG12462 [Caenorhabditis briggsae]|uniref:Uncharacterized protein n=3 Tax=Caenorhabditis briggsae TaxID=6238 RepID=A0AAE9DWA0_CAEBR|nr:Protein CBG12462 [Caenorhabditis briggsae]ULU12198.1 hypothetical protein L3Y34_015497 [Caenorhabditis briggsae]UMM13152.1 hypothetical protein L5515_001574 [Caenorhabditis briggsae]CAP31438.2 Protein CBG12462 [Caenorhabditis briggsae]
MNDDLIIPPPLQWNLQAIATCAAIVTVMVVNVIGLVFTIFWCLRTKDDGIETGGDGATANQFIEPNIRMKLKVPKVATCSKDVYEVRVPSNGNHFNACHETTIVVARNKRRRTYSLPLETRPRTQSTSSHPLAMAEV